MSAPDVFAPEVPRVSADDVERGLREGSLLLVCAYEGDVGFRKFPLRGAIALKDLIARLPGLERDTEIVFYCRCPRDKSSAERAALFIQDGWTGARVLEGGYEAAR